MSYVLLVFLILNLTLRSTSSSGRECVFNLGEIDSLVSPVKSPLVLSGDCGGVEIKATDRAHVQQQRMKVMTGEWRKLRSEKRFRRSGTCYRSG